MELRAFISESLTSIIAGVQEAQKEAVKAGAHVNPVNLMRTRNVAPNAIWDNTTNNLARTVTFDIAVTVEEGTQTKARIGVIAGIVSAKAGGQSDNRELAVSRLTFDVPILLPGSPVERLARQARGK